MLPKHTKSTETSGFAVMVIRLLSRILEDRQPLKVWNPGAYS